MNDLSVCVVDRLLLVIYCRAAASEGTATYEDLRQIWLAASRMAADRFAQPISDVRQRIARMYMEGET